MGKLEERAKQSLKSQMRAMKYEILQNGKLRVIDPPDSPDLSDAVVIASSKPRPGYAPYSPEGL